MFQIATGALEFTMGLDRLNSMDGRSGSVERRSSRVATGATNPAGASDGRAIQGGDNANFDSVEHAVRTLASQQMRLDRAMENRRKLVEAVQDAMTSGALETPQAAEKAADGILRRGVMG